MNVSLTVTAIVTFTVTVTVIITYRYQDTTFNGNGSLKFTVIELPPKTSKIQSDLVNPDLYNPYKPDFLIILGARIPL